MKAKKAAKIIAIVFISVTLIAGIGSVSTFFYLTRGVRLDAEALDNPTADLTMYDTRGNELKYASSLKVYTEYKDISQYVKDAFVAVEDKRFFKHGGIDTVRLAGAAVHNIKAGGFKEGGSTITQQLAKNALLSGEKTVERKLKEAKLAVQIEKRYSKEEILAMYLNTIYFGNGIYGITAAADRLLDKTPAEITLPEAAMLAGIVRYPYAYSPLASPQKAQERMKLALGIMKREGYIGEEEYAKAAAYEFIRPPKDDTDYSYQNAAICEAGKLLDLSEKEILSGGYRIYTYLDPKSQELVSKASSVSDFSAFEGCDWLALIADNATGGVTGYSATFDYPVHSLRRSPGSAIKPFIAYCPALEAGYISPASPVLDEKTDFDGYSPNNYGDSYLGWTNIRKAVAVSSNVVSVKLVHQMGVDYAKYSAEKFGLRFSKEDGLGAALGGLRDGVTPVEMTSAYMTLACGGINKDIGFIKEIRGSDGKTLFSRKPELRRAVSPEAAYLMTDMLMDTARSGTARKLGSLPFQIAGKTGTAGVKGSDKNSDAWNISYTSENTVCVWYGSVSNEPETLLPREITGGSYPTLVARYLHGNLPSPADFGVPEGIIPVEIDCYAINAEHRLFIAGEYTPAKYRATELFDERTALPEVSTFFDSAMPAGFRSEIADGHKIEIYFSIQPNFRYILYKKGENEDTPLCEYTGVSDGHFTDESPAFGLNTYYLSVFNVDGERIGDSDGTTVLYFGSPFSLPFSSPE